YRGRRSGRSAAFPNLWARQSHPGADRLDPAPATTQHFDNRASCFSLDSTSASYQEALLSCPCTRHLTRSSTVFEARPTTHTDREQPVRQPLWGEPLRSWPQRRALTGRSTDCPTRRKLTGP